MKFTVCYALFTLLIHFSAQATSFLIRPLSQFTQTAPYMVHGIIHNVRVEEGVAEGGKTIYTFADVEVKEVIKGSVPAASGIIVRKLGGTKDQLTLEIPGSPQFSENEETVLFLDSIPNSQMYEVVGMELGKFGLKEENGEKILTGGIFSFSSGEEVNEQTTQAGEDLSENKKPWSVQQLKELISKQTNGNPTPADTTKKSDPQNDNLLTNIFSNSTSESRDSNENNSNALQGKSVNSLSWFKIVLTFLGAGLFIYFIIRRRK